mmetsp:Transcript_33826/g.39022  ORF Transcript_33826/g.39022 Transcript_33826/m.39022 type:complete len:82 (-) Transcript_33826:744-989(-)
MAANNRYSNLLKPAGLEMTDFCAKQSNPYISVTVNGSSSMKNSPRKSEALGKSAEVLGADLIYRNEDKVRKQISFLNKEGA